MIAYYLLILVMVVIGFLLFVGFETGGYWILAMGMMAVGFSIGVGASINYYSDNPSSCHQQSPPMVPYAKDKGFYMPIPEQMQREAK